MQPTFHTFAQLVTIHRDQISRYGGEWGIRDVELLKTAAAIPGASYGGVFVHPTIPEMASAYLFHIVSGRPFCDGNRRVGMVAAVAFLARNGWDCTASGDDLYRLVKRISSNSLGKTGTAAAFEEFAFCDGCSGG